MGRIIQEVATMSPNISIQPLSNRSLRMSASTHHAAMMASPAVLDRFPMMSNGSSGSATDEPAPLAARAPYFRSTRTVSENKTAKTATQAEVPQ